MYSAATAPPLPALRFGGSAQMKCMLHSVMRNGSIPGNGTGTVYMRYNASCGTGKYYLSR